MLYTIYLPIFGEIRLHLDTLQINGRLHYVTGYDDDHNRIDFAMDRFSWLEDHFNEYGYCHIVSYTKDSVTVPCSIYRSLS